MDILCVTMTASTGLWVRSMRGKAQPIGRSLPFTLVFGILLLACAGEPSPDVSGDGTRAVTSMLPSSPPTPTRTPTPRPIRALEPPLARETFPGLTIPYPADWPLELVYPPQFSLVDESSGTLPESNTTAWAAKFRYEGTPIGADETLLAYWETSGWRVAEQIDLGGHARVFLVANGELDAEGVIVVDAEDGVTDSMLISAAYLVSDAPTGP